MNIYHNVYYLNCKHSIYVSCVFININIYIYIDLNLYNLFTFKIY